MKKKVINKRGRAKFGRPRFIFGRIPVVGTMSPSPETEASLPADPRYHQKNQHHEASLPAVGTMSPSPGTEASLPADPRYHQKNQHHEASLPADPII